MRMKIGFLNYDFAESGSGSYARAFIKSLSKNKKVDKIKILTVGNKFATILEKIPKNEIYRVKCFSGFLSRYEFILKSGCFVKFFKDVDILHAQHSFEGIFASICKKKYGIPYILVREVVSKHLPSIYSRILLFNIEKFLTKHLNYDVLVSWSKYMVENYFRKWGINPKRMTIIPGGIDTEIFNPFIKFENIRSKYGIKDDEFLFLSVKIFSKSNTLGLLNSIKAFSKFLKQNHRAKYLIVGEGKGRFYLENLIQKLGMKKNIILTGSVPSEKLVNYYKSCDATVHYFSYDPSISVSMLESLACGIPIISTNVGEVPNIVDENVGILVNPRINEMKKAMIAIQKNEGMREEMSKNAWKLIKEKFDINVISKRYVDLYSQIINE